MGKTTESIRPFFSRKYVPPVNNFVRFQIGISLILSLIFARIFAVLIQQRIYIQRMCPCQCKIEIKINICVCLFVYILNMCMK